MVNLPELIKKIYASFICEHLPELRDGLRRWASQLAIIVKKYKYIMIGVYLALASGFLLLLASNFQEKTISLISAFISALATIAVGFAALHANNNIAETNSSFLQKHESLLHKNVAENRKQNEFMLRSRKFDEISLYLNSINELYNCFATEHYPIKLVERLHTLENGNITSIEFINFCETEKNMTLKAKRILRSTRFYVDSILPLVLAFDDYLEKYSSIQIDIQDNLPDIPSHKIEQYITDVKMLSDKISKHFLKYLQDTEALLNRIDNDSMSYAALSECLNRAYDNKKIIRRKLYEEYARRNTTNEQSE